MNSGDDLTAIFAVIGVVLLLTGIDNMRIPLRWLHRFLGLFGLQLSVETLVWPTPEAAAKLGVTSEIMQIYLRISRKQP